MSRTARAAVALAATLLLVASACSSDSDSATTTTAGSGDTAVDSSTTTDASSAAGDCDSITATFREVTSANAALPDPELAAACDGDVVTVTTNGIPDYTYVGTSPGDPAAQDLTFKIPVTPAKAAEPSDVALLGPIAVAVNGVPIYGPTEGTGGDVLSLEGALSECGSHNGPTGFHLHLFGWAQGVDCLYSADEAEAAKSVQVGWSVDGYPIMSGLVCADDACTSTKQLKSSWELSDESQFATDTWSAHSYVEGSGDLDQCNGRTDSDSQYRYYTTTTFPYILGCYSGAVADDAIAGAAGAAGGPGGPGGQ